MTSVTQAAARTAAQLHQAASEVARLAARRSSSAAASGNGAEPLWADRHGDVGNGQESGTAIRAMARMLAERGFDICLPHRAISFCLTVAGAKGGRCQIDIDDNDRLGWEYISGRGDAAEPAEIAEVVLRLLCKDNPGSDGSYEHLHKAATLKGAVGREMQARGLAVKLNTYEDDVYFDACADVEITNPARPERGLVFVADDGIVKWEFPEYASETEVMAAVADLTAQMLIPDQNGGHR